MQLKNTVCFIVVETYTHQNETKRKKKRHEKQFAINEITSDIKSQINYE